MRTLALRLCRIDRVWLVLADWPWIGGMRGRVCRGWDKRCVRTRSNVGAGEDLAWCGVDNCRITAHNCRGSLHLKKLELNESQIYECKGMEHFKLYLYSYLRAFSHEPLSLIVIGPPGPWEAWVLISLTHLLPHQDSLHRKNQDNMDNVKIPNMPCLVLYNHQ